MTAMEPKLEDQFSEKLFMAFIENGKTGLKPVCEEFAMKIAELALEGNTQGIVANQTLVNYMLRLLVDSMITSGTKSWSGVCIQMWTAFHYSAQEQRAQAQGVGVSGADKR